jgi:hypothetical protein
METQMLFSTQVSTAKCKTIQGNISLDVVVLSLSLNESGLYVNYEMRLPGEGQLVIKEGQKFIPTSDPNYNALAKPIAGLAKVFETLAPKMIEETL